ncbi:hypothetical protein GCM10009804_05990 [Kribbella hippodromi]|uniref:Uncharacterized protein n=1 Tax=Kribbella hippodromi TaxID=434347 RepID=A0ABN2C3S2_9ACTN
MDATRVQRRWMPPAFDADGCPPRSTPMVSPRDQCPPGALVIGPAPAAAVAAVVETGIQTFFLGLSSLPQPPEPSELMTLCGRSGAFRCQAAWFDINVCSDALGNFLSNQP